MDLQGDVVGDQGQALDGLQPDQLDLVVEHVHLEYILRIDQPIFSRRERAIEAIYSTQWAQKFWHATDLFHPKS